MSCHRTGPRFVNPGPGSCQERNEIGGPILALEGLFLAANLTKLVHGAWPPLLIGVAIFTVFTTLAAWTPAGDFSARGY